MVNTSAEGSLMQPDLARQDLGWLEMAVDFAGLPSILNALTSTHQIVARIHYAWTPNHRWPNKFCIIALPQISNLPEVDSFEDGVEALSIVHSGNKDVTTIVLARLRETRHSSCMFLWALHQFGLRSAHYLEFKLIWMMSLKSQLYCTNRKLHHSTFDRRRGLQIGERVA